MRPNQPDTYILWKPPPLEARPKRAMKARVRSETEITVPVHWSTTKPTAPTEDSGWHEATPSPIALGSPIFIRELIGASLSARLFDAGSLWRANLTRSSHEQILHFLSDNPFDRARYNRISPIDNQSTMTKLSNLQLTDLTSAASSYLTKLMFFERSTGYDLFVFLRAEGAAKLLQDLRAAEDSEDVAFVAECLQGALILGATLTTRLNQMALSMAYSLWSFLQMAHIEILEGGLDKKRVWSVLNKMECVHDGGVIGLYQVISFLELPLGNTRMPQRNLAINFLRNTMKTREEEARKKAMSDEKGEGEKITERKKEDELPRVAREMRDAETLPIGVSPEERKRMDVDDVITAMITTVVRMEAQHGEMVSRCSIGMQTMAKSVTKMLAPDLGPTEEQKRKEEMKQKAEVTLEDVRRDIEERKKRKVEKGKEKKRRMSVASRTRGRTVTISSPPAHSRRSISNDGSARYSTRPDREYYGTFMLHSHTTDSASPDNEKEKKKKKKSMTTPTHSSGVKSLIGSLSPSTPDSVQMKAAKPPPRKKRRICSSTEEEEEETPDASSSLPRVLKGPRQLDVETDSVIHFPHTRMFVRKPKEEPMDVNEYAMDDGDSERTPNSVNGVERRSSSFKAANPQESEETMKRIWLWMEGMDNVRQSRDERERYSPPPLFPMEVEEVEGEEMEDESDLGLDDIESSASVLYDTSLIEVKNEMDENDSQLEEGKRQRKPTRPRDMTPVWDYSEFGMPDLTNDVGGVGAPDMTDDAVAGLMEDERRREEMEEMEEEKGEEKRGMKKEVDKMKKAPHSPLGDHSYAKSRKEKKSDHTYAMPKLEKEVEEEVIDVVTLDAESVEEEVKEKEKEKKDEKEATGFEMDEDVEEIHEIIEGEDEEMPEASLAPAKKDEEEEIQVVEIVKAHKESVELHECKKGPADEEEKSPGESVESTEDVTGAVLGAVENLLDSVSSRLGEDKKAEEKRNPMSSPIDVIELE